MDPAYTAAYWAAYAAATAGARAVAGLERRRAPASKKKKSKAKNGEMARGGAACTS
jgi:hypothetical protein